MSSQHLSAITINIPQQIYPTIIENITTLDKLLNGNIDSKSSFDRHLQKILKLLNITVEDLMLYHSAPSKLSEATLYSQNAPMNHEMNDTAKKQYNLLLDIIDLCAIYY